MGLVWRLLNLILFKCVDKLNYIQSFFFKHSFTVILTLFWLILFIIFKCFYLCAWNCFNIYMYFFFDCYYLFYSKFFSHLALYYLFNHIIYGSWETHFFVLFFPLDCCHHVFYVAEVNYVTPLGYIFKIEVV